MYSLGLTQDEEAATTYENTRKWDAACVTGPPSASASASASARARAHNVWRTEKLLGLKLARGREREREEGTVNVSRHWHENTRFAT